MAQAANTADFFGEGTAAPAVAPGQMTQEQLDDLLMRQQAAANTRAATATANINANTLPYNQAVTPEQAAAARPGGATGAYESVSPAGQAAFDRMHELGKDSGYGGGGAKGSWSALDKWVNYGPTANPMNRGGYDPLLGNGASTVQTPTATDPSQTPAAALDAAIAPPGGGGGGAIAPVNTGNPGAIQAAAAGSTPTFGAAPSIGTVNAALTNFRPAPAAPATGTMATAPGQVSMGALPGREAISALPGTGKMGALPGVVGQGALPGTVQMGALPGQTDRSLQTAALDRVLGYDANTSSKAEAQLADAQQMNLSNSLALARSARGGPAAQAQALRAAQGEGAATMSQSARDLATLRAQEEDTAKQRELSALGLGGDITGAIRTGDIGERGQNVGAVEAALTAGTEQRGQTIGAVTADQAARASQRGQTIGALETERTTGATERGQTIGAQSNALNAGVAQRGQDVGSLEAALTAGVAQRGQTVEQQIAERNAGVTERGQTTTAGTAANQQALDAILGTGQLAQTERNAGVTERGQNIQAATSQEQIAAQRDIANNANLTEQQKISASTAVQKAALGYELTPQEKLDLEYAKIRAGKPGALQQGLGVVQSIASLGKAFS